MVNTERARDGKRLGSERDAIALIGEALQRGAGLVVVPAERFEDDFFRLGTRIAGDISRHVSASRALRDFVREVNRGDHVWFAASVAEIEKRLLRDAASD